MIGDLTKNEYNRQYYLKNKEAAKRYYYEVEKKKYKERYKNRTPEEIEKNRKMMRERSQTKDDIERRKKYNQRPEVKKQLKEYKQRPEVRERLKEQGREIRKTDKSKIYRKKYMRNYFNKLRQDKSFRLFANLRSRISVEIKKDNGIKSKRSIELIGCSIEFLRKYLEKQFESDMTWENRGFYGWHIDHIIPCVRFDLTDLEQQKKCFHYTNLQPLWATTEIAKKYGSNSIGNLNKGSK